MNLFYERYQLGKNIPGIEEGELSDGSGISSVKVCLYDFAQRLKNLGLGDEGNYELTYVDSDSVSIYDFDYDSYEEMLNR